MIIVGAGAAGLAAGARLAQSGKRVALLEARDRIGGRIFTRRLPAAEGQVCVELGAEFVHGLPSETWSLIGRAKLAAYEIEGSDISFIDGAWAPPANQPATHVIAAMMKWLESRPGCDMSFAEYQATVPADAAADAAAANYVEGFNAADRHRIGIASLALQQRAEDAIEGDRVFHVASGYDSIPEFLASQFRAAGGELTLGAAVRRIEWQARQCTNHGGSAERAGPGAAGAPGIDHGAARRAAGGTASLSRRRRRTFSRRHSGLAMGEVVRVTLLFRERFWRSASAPSVPEDVRRKLADLSFLFTPAEVPPTWWTPHPAPTPMLTAWVGGSKATALRRSIAAGRRRPGAAAPLPRDARPGVRVALRGAAEACS